MLFRYGYTPLIWAASNGNKEIILLLLSKGAEINFVNKDGGSALWYAVTNQKVGTLRLLLEKGADPNIKFMDSQTPLEYAEERNRDKYIEIAEILKKSGARK
jgi:ankyrin repeat protein